MMYLAHTYSQSQCSAISRNFICNALARQAAEEMVIALRRVNKTILALDAFAVISNLRVVILPPILKRGLFYNSLFITPLGVLGSRDGG